MMHDYYLRRAAVSQTQNANYGWNSPEYQKQWSGQKGSLMCASVLTGTKWYMLNFIASIEPYLAIDCCYLHVLVWQHLV